jgi:hypothetical protein
VLSLRNALIVVLVLIATGLGVWIASAALTQVTVVFTIDETDPAGFTNPVDDDCPIGSPCKVKSDLNVADNNQPAASVTSISPTAFVGVGGTSIPNGTTVVGNTHVVVWWDAFSASCSSPSWLKVEIDSTKDFLDGGIKGEVADDITQDALGMTGVWPTRLETDLRVSYMLSHSHPVLRRSVAVLDGPAGLTKIPINLLSFDVSDGNGFAGLTLKGTYNVAVVGDPTTPPPPGTSMCTPMSSVSILLGEAAVGFMLQTCEAAGTHTMTTVLTRESGGVLVIDANKSDTVTCSIPVGGIAEYPDIAGPAGKSSSLPSGALAGAAAAGAVVLAGTAWYARRRWAR